MRAGALGTVLALFLSAPLLAERFDSTLPLKVYVRRQGAPDRLLGFTPTKPKHRIERPENGLWYVQPIGSLSGVAMQKLGELLRRRRIPGLDLQDHWELSAARFEHLGNQKQLRYLNISRTPLTDVSVRAAAQWKGLTTFFLSENTTDTGFASLGSLPKLKELSLDRTHITDKSLLTMLQLQQLEKLDLSGTAISDNGLLLLGQIPTLKLLVLGGGITDGASRSLAKLIKLQELDFSETQLTDEGLKAIASLPALKSVFVNKQLGDKGLERLAKSSSIETLDLSGSAISDKGLGALGRMRSLQDLALTDTNVTDDGVANLAKFPNLQTLELSNTRVTSAGMLQFSSTPQLRTLSFSWDWLSRDDVVNLSKLTHIRTILLNGVPLSGEIMAQLRELAKSPVVIQSSAQKQAALGKSAPIAPVSVPLAMPQARPHAVPDMALASPGPAPIQPSPKLSPFPILSPNTVVRRKGFAPAAVSSLPGETLNSPLAAPASTPATPKSEPFTVEKLSGKTRREAFGSLESGQGDMALSTQGPSAAQGPGGVAQKEDQILKAITLRAKQAGKLSVPNLASLRSLRTDLSGLTDVMPGNQASIEMRQDKPENKIGDLTISAGH